MLQTNLFKQSEKHPIIAATEGSFYKNRFRTKTFIDQGFCDLFHRHAWSVSISLIPVDLIDCMALYVILQLIVNCLYLSLVINKSINYCLSICCHDANF